MGLFLSKKYIPYFKRHNKKLFLIDALNVSSCIFFLYICLYTGFIMIWHCSKIQLFACQYSANTRFLHSLDTYHGVTDITVYHHQCKLTHERSHLHCLSVCSSFHCIFTSALLANSTCFSMNPLTFMKPPYRYSHIIIYTYTNIRGLTDAPVR